MSKLIKKNKGMLSNEKGSLMLMSYLVIVLLLGLGAAFFRLAATETKISDHQKLQTMAFHIAEAGIERALYDLRQDFVNDSTPSWADGDINGYAIGPDTNDYYEIPYSDGTLNGGSYTVQIKNTSGGDIWVQAISTLDDLTHTIQVYARMVDLSPWNNAIFAGAGASGMTINGNVDIRGSIHILGTGLLPTDIAIDLSGSSTIGNNYSGLSSGLAAKVPALPTTVFNGETVETLSAEVRVKNGKVGLSGSATLGEADNAGDGDKETMDGVYVTDGFSGTAGASSVYSDNGTSNAYDLGESLGFPSLSDPHPDDPSQTVQEYFHSQALVLTTELSSLDPSDSFTYTDGTNSISMDGNGNLNITGQVYVDNNGVTMSKSGPDKTITYTGVGTLLVEGDVQIDVNLVTNGVSSFPSNNLGIMTPNNIGFDAFADEVMGVFYAEDTVTLAKQVDMMGTVVSNYFDMGSNVPSVYQVPEIVNNMPPGMIGENLTWYMIVSWQKL